jgi:hypothetical protein
MIHQNQDSEAKDELRKDILVIYKALSRQEVK